jgi:hypothetical protein
MNQARASFSIRSSFESGPYLDTRIIESPVPTRSSPTNMTIPSIPSSPTVVDKRQAFPPILSPNSRYRRTVKAHTSCHHHIITSGTVASDTANLGCACHGTKHVGTTKQIHNSFCGERQYRVHVYVHAPPRVGHSNVNRLIMIKYSLGPRV